MEEEAAAPAAPARTVLPAPQPRGKGDAYLARIQKRPKDEEGEEGAAVAKRSKRAGAASEGSEEEEEEERCVGWEGGRGWMCVYVYVYGCACLGGWGVVDWWLAAAILLFFSFWGVVVGGITSSLSHCLPPVAQPTKKSERGRFLWWGLNPSTHLPMASVRAAATRATQFIHPFTHPPFGQQRGRQRRGRREQQQRGGRGGGAVPRPV